MLEIGLWGPEIWLHEYLINPIENSVNWSVPNSYEPDQFTLLSMGLTYSYGPISGLQEPIHVKFGVCVVFLSCSPEKVVFNIRKLI